MQSEVIQSIINFLNDRLEEERLESTASLSPLKKLDPSVTNDQLKACYNAICPDMPLLDFEIEDLKKLNTQLSVLNHILLT